jgi:hypothetical protein
MNLSAGIRGRDTSFRTNTHLTGFQERGRGSGVRIVYLEDGRVRELMYEPADGLHLMAMARTDVYGVSPSGKRMVLVGLGLDADKYRVVKSAGVRGAAASILCYDPAQAKEPPPPPAKPTVATGPSRGKNLPKLNLALCGGDLAAVKAFLDGGGDPNQPLVLVAANPGIHGEILTTPLRLAASGHPEVVKLLLERGAKPTILSIPGLTAMDMASKEMDAGYPQWAEGRKQVRKILHAAGAKRRQDAVKK